MYIVADLLLRGMPGPFARVKLFEGQGKSKVDAVETQDMFDNSQRILDSSDDDTEKK